MESCRSNKFFATLSHGENRGSSPLRERQGSCSTGAPRRIPHIPLLSFGFRDALMTDPQAWPLELRLHKDRKTLTVAFDGGESFNLPAEYLRVKSPSAEVQGHSAEERKTVPGKRDVGIMEVLPVGNYAVRLVFDDMHSTGIFDWDYLRDLGRNHTAYWRDYLDDLAAKNLTREPPARRK